MGEFYVMYSVVVFSIFTEFCNYPQVYNIVITPKRNPVPLSSDPLLVPPQVRGN